MDSMLPRLLLGLLSSIAVTAQKQESESSKQVYSKFSYDEEIQEKLVRLEHKVELREKTLRDWGTRIATTLTKLEQKKKKMRKTIATADKIITDIESNMAALETAFQEKLQSHDLTVQSFLENYNTPTILFKARLVSSKDITDGTVLVFTEVIANAGDGYSNCTGHFTAPVHGTYMFTAQLCSLSTGAAMVYLVANGTIIEATSHRGTTFSGECITLTGVSVLDEGETASVQGSYTYANALFESQYRWNTFSGILINIVVF